MAQYRLTFGPSIQRDSDGAFIPPDPLNVDWQIYQAWLAAGNIPDAYVTPAIALTSVQVNSASTPALDGVYSFDPVSSQNMTAEAVYIQATTAQGAAKFSNGQTTKPWPDAAGNLHTFTTSQFITLAEGLAQFADAVVTAAQNGIAFPAGPVQIP
jgi:hypothetical protein